MKKTIAKNLTAGVENFLFDSTDGVPKGFQAVVTMLFIANSGGSTGEVLAEWHRAIEGDVITFQASKSVSAGENIQFGGPYGHFCVLKEGDNMCITPGAGHTFVALMSFEFIRNNIK